MKKKKIIFLMPSLVGGGAENALIKLLKAFNYRQYQVTVLIVSNKGIYIKKVPNQVKLIYLFKSHNLVKLLAYIQKKHNWSLFLKWAFKRKVKDEYDTAISFLDSNFTDLLFLLPPKTKKITWVHSSYVSNKNFNKFYQNKKYLSRVIENRYKKLDSIVFVSNDAKNEFIEVMGEFENMPVLYNLFDEEYLRQRSQEKLPKKETVTFIAVGSLIPVKGYELLIEATKILKNKAYKFKVEIIGNGHQETELKSKVKKLNLNKEIDFLGYLPNPYAFMNRADVFVMTSVSEALPSALIEAMIIGKPVLITKTAGCREVIEYGKYGMMTERTPEAFAEKMIECIENPKMLEKYAKLALIKAQEFSKQNILSKFFEIID